MSPRRTIRCEVPRNAVDFLHIDLTKEKSRDVPTEGDDVLRLARTNLSQQLGKVTVELLLCVVVLALGSAPLSNPRGQEDVFACRETYTIQEAVNLVLAASASSEHAA